MAGQMPFWESLPRIVHSFAQRLASHTLMCFYMAEALPSPDTGFSFDGDAIVSRESPLHSRRNSFYKLRELTVSTFKRAGYPVLARKRRPYVWHELALCGSESTREQFGFRSRLPVHGISNLFVVDASCCRPPAP